MHLTLTTETNSLPNPFRRSRATPPQPWMRNFPSPSPVQRLRFLIYNILHIFIPALQLLILTPHLQFCYRRRTADQPFHKNNRVKRFFRRLQGSSSRQIHLPMAPRLLHGRYVPCLISMLGLHPQVLSRASSQDGDIIHK